MSIDASASRQRLSDGQDAIALTVRLTKGGNGGLRIHDAVVIGRKWLNRWPGQWRTTIVSLPASP